MERSARWKTLTRMCERLLRDFPWDVVVDVSDETLWTHRGSDKHWSGEPLRVSLRTERAVATLASLDLFGVLELFLHGEVEFRGNLYVLADLKNAIGREVSGLRALRLLLSGLRVSSRARTERDVQSHYDVPQEALDLYLDRAYASYSCAIFEDPGSRTRGDLVRVGHGRVDAFDSLEKAQWRKFNEAAQLLDLDSGTSLLDVGTGYGGLLRVGIADFDASNAVGWTLSANQARGARTALQEITAKVWEIHQGDFRQERRTFDRVASIGMVSHVGPRGLRPYLRAIRDRVRRGGLYLHHDLMIESSWIPQSLQLGPSFNRRYVWPGFYWFTLDAHVRALETTGFRVLCVCDLSRHYAKTAAAWFERLVARELDARRLLGDLRFRAWQVFLAGISGSLDNGGVRDHRILCEAV